MRIDNEFTYQDRKEEASDSFSRLGDKGYETASVITDWSVEDSNAWLVDDACDTFIWALAFAEYEERHGILEERLHITVSRYIDLYREGFFDKDLLPSEREEVETDVKYLESRIEIYPLDEIYKPEEEPEEDNP